MSLSNILAVLQIIISLALVAAVLLQQRGQGLSAGFLGGAGSSFHTKRGLEKGLYIATIVLGVFFVAAAVLSLVLRP